MAEAKLLEYGLPVGFWRGTLALGSNSLTTPADIKNAGYKLDWNWFHILGQTGGAISLPWTKFWGYVIIFDPNTGAKVHWDLVESWIGKGCEPPALIPDGDAAHYRRVQNGDEFLVGTEGDPGGDGDITGHESKMWAKVRMAKPSVVFEFFLRNEVCGATIPNF